MIGIWWALLLLVFLSVGCNQGLSAISSEQRSSSPTKVVQSKNSPTPVLVRPTNSESPSPTPTPVPTRVTSNWQGQLAVAAYELNQTNDNPMLRLVTADPLDSVDFPGYQQADFPFSWSSDGQKLIFAASVDLNSGNPDDLSSVYLASAPQWSVEKVDLALRGGVFKGSPSFSPDGQRIVFYQYGADRQLIYLLDLKTGETKYLVDGSIPFWANDQIVFLQHELQDDRYTPWGDLYEIHTDGSGLKQITQGVSVHSFAVSPDGQKIAYIISENDIYVMNRDGSQPKILFHSLSTGFWSPVPSWSATGNSIFVSNNCRILEISMDGHKKELTGLPEKYCYLYASLRPSP